MDDLIRERIDNLIRGNKTENYASVSRLLGKNHAYIQQYITRSTPRRLHERDRRLIAQHFGVPPGTLFVGGGIAEDLLQGPSLSTGKSHSVAGEQTPLHSLPVEPEETPALSIGFSDGLLRSLTEGYKYDGLRVTKIQGDAMEPTVSDGDLILVAAGTDVSRRDGLYALRIHHEIVARRLSFSPEGKTVIVSCDNSLYKGWHDCDPGALDILGPVIWYGRKL